MSSDNAQSVVTYTPISSDSDGPSWGIPLINADEFLEMDPYKEEYHAPSDDDIQALIDAFVAGSSLFPLPPTSLAYVQAPLGHKAAMIRRKDDSLKRTCHLEGDLHLLFPTCPGHDTRTIARAADRAKDVGYVRDLQDSEHRMMTSIDEVNLRTDRRDIRPEIDVVRGQRTAYETKLQEARARTDTVEDADSSCHEAAYAMTWGTLKKKMTDKYYPKGEIKKLEIKLWNLRVKGNDVAAYTQPRACYEFGNTLHITKNCPKLKNHENGSRNGVAQGRAYVLGGRDASLDSNINTGTFLLYNRYVKILFDTGVDKSFVSTTFSASIDITPTTLENRYDVELADGKIIGVNTIIRGFTLNFRNHPFNIDLMPVPLDSFDIIIGMDWLTKYHGVIICDEKIVRVPFEREMLIFQGNRDNQMEES
nr:reverse transcriptase domain-containing protein [Tanacetum cinerariifolium]